MLRNLVVLSAAVFFVLGAQADELGDMLATCQQAVEGKIPFSPKLDVICNHEFELPSPLTLRCLRGTEIPEVCEAHCEMNENWGPWADLQIEVSLQGGLSRMQQLHAAGACAHLLNPVMASVQ